MTLEKILERTMHGLETLWQSLCNRLTRSRAFVVERVPDGEVFVVAHNVRATKDGCLVFTSWLSLVRVAVFGPGEWRRVQRVVIVEDLRGD